MPRELTREEIANEARASAGANALHLLGLSVRNLSTPYAKPVFHLILDAQHDVRRSEKYRLRCAARARGVNDVLQVIPDTDGVLAVLTEIVSTVDAILQTDYAAGVEIQNIAGLTKALEPFQGAGVRTPGDR